MSENNGIAGRISTSMGGTIIDRRFGSLLIIDSGLGGEVAIDVARVTSVLPGQAEAVGGARMNITTVLVEGQQAPVLIASRGVVAVAEAIARAREAHEDEQYHTKLSRDRQTRRRRAEEQEKSYADMIARGPLCEACSVEPMKLCACCHAVIRAPAGSGAVGGPLAGAPLGSGALGPPDNPHLADLDAPDGLDPLAGQATG